MLLDWKNQYRENVKKKKSLQINAGEGVEKREMQEGRDMGTYVYV